LPLIIGGSSSTSASPPPPPMPRCVIPIDRAGAPAVPDCSYVAPYGMLAGDGSADAPKTLGWAMQSASAGTTIWLMPGTYTGDWTANAPGITYRSVPGTRARLDGSLTVAAADVTVQGLEITDTSWTNRAQP